MMSPGTVMLLTGSFLTFRRMFTLEKLFLGKILIVLVKFIFYTIFKNLIFSGVKNFIIITSTFFHRF